MYLTIPQIYYLFAMNQKVIEYVNSHPETLLVVTADHETGGTGAEKFAGVMKNIDIPEKIDAFIKK